MMYVMKTEISLMKAIEGALPKASPQMQAAMQRRLEQIYLGRHEAALALQAALAACDGQPVDGAIKDALHAYWLWLIPSTQWNEYPEKRYQPMMEAIEKLRTLAGA